MNTSDASMHYKSNPPMGWSELISDALLLVYQRLSLADFARARTVCSSWYFVSRSSSPRENHVPWLIFKEDRNWKLFNPEEGKSYKTHINRLGFSDCRSVATCGNWVLVTDDKAYLYMFNPFTLKIIDLPPLNSYGTYKLPDNYPIHFDYGSRQRPSDNCPIHSHYSYVQRRFVRVDTAVLWVDERTKDYLVVWKSRGRRDCLRFCMEGDEEWLETPGEYGSIDHMVYKDKKLYILSEDGAIKILDFSQDFPREVPNHPYVNRPFRLWNDHYNYHYHYHYHYNNDTKKMRLTTSGDVRIIQRVYQNNDEKTKFVVCKMNSSNEGWEMVNYLDEDEKELLWDFCDYYWDFCELSFLKDTTYELLPQKIERLRDLRGVSHEPTPRWLLPCFGFEE